MAVEVEDRRPLNAVRYAAKDFPTFFDSLLRRMKLEYGDDYNDYVATSIGIMLIDLMAYGLSQMTWYTDRVASDCYLDTARTRHAISKLVKQIGYKMGGATSATTDLVLTFEATTKQSKFEAGHQFKIDSLIFEVTADVTVPIGSTTTTVNVREGTSRKLRFRSTGASGQVFRLTGITVDTTYLAEGSTRVFVDGGEWDEVDFLEFEKTNQFEVAHNEDPPTITFGDGVVGNVPPADADISVTYVVVNGKAGNLT